MDTRKLINNGEAFIDIGNGDGMVPIEEIITEDGLKAGQDYDTLFYAFDEEPADEMVKRWNAYPDLVAALKALVQTIEYQEENNFLNEDADEGEENDLTRARSLLTSLNAH